MIARADDRLRLSSAEGRILRAIVTLCEIADRARPQDSATEDDVRTTSDLLDALGDLARAQRLIMSVSNASALGAQADVTDDQIDAAAPS